MNFGVSRLWAYDWLVGGYYYISTGYDYFSLERGGSGGILHTYLKQTHVMRARQ